MWDTQGYILEKPGLLQDICTGAAIQRHVRTDSKDRHWILTYEWDQDLLDHGTFLQGPFQAISNLSVACPEAYQATLFWSTPEKRFDIETVTASHGHIVFDKYLLADETFCVLDNLASDAVLSMELHFQVGTHPCDMPFRTGICHVYRWKPMSVKRPQRLCTEEGHGYSIWYCIDPGQTTKTIFQVDKSASFDSSESDSSSGSHSSDKASVSSTDNEKAVETVLYGHHQDVSDVRYVLQSRKGITNQCTFGR